MADAAWNFFLFISTKDLEDEVEPETIGDWLNECINNSKIKWSASEQSVTRHCYKNVADGVQER